MPRSATVATLCLAVICARAEESVQCEWPNTGRIVAIGDIHGAYDQFVQILQAAKVIGEDHQWIAGATRLVQTGDVPDRGADSRKAYDLLMRLEKEAMAVGGQVHALIGNHDAWMILGDLRYAVEGEFTAFATKESAARRAEFLRAHPDVNPEQLPLGFLEHRAAFSTRGPYGSWIASHNTVIKIGDTLFLHAGLTERYGTMPLAKLNEMVRAELRQKHDGKARYPVLEDAESPVMYRGLALDDEKEIAPLVDTILRFHKAKRIVIGHTVTYGPIKHRLNGRVVMIDCGMNPIYWEGGGRPAALEIMGGQLRELYLPEKKL